MVSAENKSCASGLAAATPGGNVSKGIDEHRCTFSTFDNQSTSLFTSALSATPTVSQSPL
jgi:hypothetical protein